MIEQLDAMHHCYTLKQQVRGCTGGKPLWLFISSLSLSLGLTSG